VTTTGQITRLVDVSAVKGHVVPTSLGHNGNTLYVGNLGVFPQDAGSSKVWLVGSAGDMHTIYTVLNMVLGVTFDRFSRMYVLQASVAPAPTPGTGSIARFDTSGHRTSIADSLFLPTAVTVGPDHNLYVSNVGFGAPPVGQGEILKIEVTD
jgi:hypothetical protein